jgi:hypothetical protein
LGNIEGIWESISTELTNSWGKPLEKSYARVLEVQEELLEGDEPREGFWEDDI